MDDLLARRFEAERGRLRAIARRMLGASGDADDAVQEAWLRLQRTDAVENLPAWLTAVVARICLDALRARRTRRETPLSDQAAEDDPQADAVRGDLVGAALQVVLDRLSPAERVAFVLHDLFEVPFEEVAPLVGRTPTAARQLASRARRRVREAETGQACSREVVDAFRHAAQGGDLAGLLAVLAPDVVLRADPAATALGAPAEAHGPQAIVDRFLGQARAARPALVGGEPGLAWAVGGVVRVAFRFTVEDGRVAAIDLLADPATHVRLGVALEASSPTRPLRPAVSRRSGD